MKKNIASSHDVENTVFATVDSNNFSNKKPRFSTPAEYKNFMIQEENLNLVFVLLSL